VSRLIRHRSVTHQLKPGVAGSRPFSTRRLDTPAGSLSGGDVRRLADLFGLSIQAGTRYTSVIGHPDLSGNDQS